MARRPRATTTRTSDAATARTADSIINASARLGLGSDSVASQAGYSYSILSRNRQLLDNAYRSSWLTGQAVDAVASDMTRAGLEMTGDVDPSDIEQIQNEFNELCIWQHLASTVRWARLYGGCIAVMLIDGQNPATPLRVETVRKDQFKGLLVLDRWMVTPSLEDVVVEYGPDMGQPRFYRVNSTQNPMSNQSADAYGGNYGIGNAGINRGQAGSGDYVAVSIHYTRVIRIDGNELPFFARQGEQGWGASILERLYDRLLAYDSATQGAAQLVYKAHLRTIKLKDLRQAIAMGGRAFEGIANNVDFIRKFQTSDGLTLLDKDDEFETHQYAFGGLPELLAQFSEQLSGALQIPLVRLFGQSPAGFSTGETDLQNYYDMIGAQQEAKLRRPIGRLLEIVSRSRLGRPLPPGFGFKFTPLWGLSAAEKADVSSKSTEAVMKAMDGGVISQKVALEELRQSSHTTGIFTNISDEDIAQAETEPPSASEALVGVDPNGNPVAADTPSPANAAAAKPDKPEDNTDG